MPEGTYRVDFELLGFEVIRRNHVRVRSGSEASIDVALPARSICECISLDPPSPWAQRVGQVIDANGHPLPHARINLVGRQVAYADNEGRFLVRDAASVVLTLEYVGTTGVPDQERFGGCECDGYLLRYGGR